MGSELYRMIRDGAPPGWTPPMVLVASMIADDARDPSQRDPGEDGWPWSAIPVEGRWTGRKWHDGLTERTGMAPSTIRRALADLETAGYRMRQPIATGKDGRPVFAAKGHAVRFQVPPLPPRPVPERPQSPPDASTYDGSQRRSDMAQRRSDSVPKALESATPISPGPPIVPPDISHPSSPADVEGRARARETTNDDQDSSGDSDRPGPAPRTPGDGKGICAECGQRVELMRTMRGEVVRSHDRGRKGEMFCPGTGEPPAVEPPS